MLSASLRSRNDGGPLGDRTTQRRRFRQESVCPGDSDPTLRRGSACDSAPFENGSLPAPAPSPSHEDPDRALVQSVLAGDATTYGVLVARHEERLRRLLFGILGESHLVEDAMQDSFLIAYRRLADFRGDARFSSWLTRIALREAMRMKRRLSTVWRRWHSLDEHAPREPEVTNVEARDLDQDEEIGVLLRALPAMERAAFVLYVEGHTHQEIAETMDRPIGTVSCWIHRAKDRLRGAWLRRNERVPRAVGLRAAPVMGEKR